MKIIKKIINILEGVIKKYYSFQNSQEHEERINLVCKSVINNIPIVYPSITSFTYCKNGEWNYMSLLDNDLCKIHLTITNIPLFVYVGSVASSSWEYSNSRGVSRWDWEVEQANIASIKSKIPNLRNSKGESSVYLLCIDWNTPINDEYIAQLLKDLKINV